MTNDFRADLHCHTTCSDGTVRPDDIIQLAIDKQLQGLSITDHDSIEAYKVASSTAQAKGLALVSGVELSAVHRKTSIHILAYSFPVDSTLIHEFCERHFERRKQRSQAILKLLAAHGMPLTDDDFPVGMFSSQTRQSIGRPHIAYAMVQKGYTPALQQAFHDYLGEGKPCFVPGEAYSIEETLDVIHRAKGLAVIAHPHLIQEVGIVKELLTMNFDGIEGYYARFPRTANERWLKIAARKGWLVTGGSDFHGEIKPNLPLGSSWVNEETFTVLQQHQNQHYHPE